MIKIIPPAELYEYMQAHPGTTFSEDFYTNNSGKFDNIDSIDEYLNVKHYLATTDFYLDRDKIHDIFKQADWEIAVRNHKMETPPVRDPIEIPMPTVRTIRGCEGPLVADENWFINKSNKYYKKYVKFRKISQQEMMELLATRDEIRYKLGQLKPGDKKYKKKVLKYNEELKDIQSVMDWLSFECGVTFDSLDKGTWWSRFVRRVKDGWKNFKKGVKKFYHRHQVGIKFVAGIVLPFFGKILINKLADKFGW